MNQIEVDFSRYLPTLGTFYGYFNILKNHHFIEDVTVVEKEGQNLIRVYRHEDRVPQKIKPEF